MMMILWGVLIALGVVMWWLAGKQLYRAHEAFVHVQDAAVIVQEHQDRTNLCIKQAKNDMQAVRALQYQLMCPVCKKHNAPSKDMFN